jgi:hypothetical protein
MHRCAGDRILFVLFLIVDYIVGCGFGAQLNLVPQRSFDVADVLVIVYQFGEISILRFRGDGRRFGALLAPAGVHTYQKKKSKSEQASRSHESTSVSGAFFSAAPIRC